MNTQNKTVMLQGAHVLDPAQNIDGIRDVIIRDGKIAAVNAPGTPVADVDTTINLTGRYLSPGWIDIHVHAYGTLGFADPDSIGLYQGVTTFVEAGGPGVGTLDEFLATMTGRTKTSLYIGPYIRPLGIIGLSYIEGDVRSLDDIPLRKWLDVASEHRDLLRYLKIGAFENYGTGPLKLGKGLAEMLELPIYSHIGEFHTTPGNPAGALDIFDVAQAGDMITHVYHNNIGRIIDDNGKVWPIVRNAQKRGVLFDIGFGGYNFSWKVAEAAYGQDLCPDIISSDLQQFNVMGPVYSLSNVMNVFSRLGLSLNEVIQRVTAAPARALKLDDRAGSLKPGLPADITVFTVEDGEFELADCHSEMRSAKSRIVPLMAFKNGEQFDCDLERCQDERNWFMQIAESHIPAQAQNLSSAQFAFLRTLADELNATPWTVCSVQDLKLDRALDLQKAFHRARARHAIGLREALTAVYDCFLDAPFAIQIGLFLLRLDRAFVLERLNQVVRPHPVAA